MKRWAVVIVIASLLGGCDGCALDVADARTPATFEDVNIVDVDRRADAVATDAPSSLIDVVNNDGGATRDAGRTSDVSFRSDVGFNDVASEDVSSNDVAAEDVRNVDVRVNIDVAHHDALQMQDVQTLDVSFSDANANDGGENNAPPSCNNAGLCLTLEWDAPYGDLDLHVSLNAQPWCTDDACYFGNCTAGGPFRVEWDGVDGFSAGDPTLVDDGFANGPEVFTIENPFIANYVVGAYFQPNNNAPVDATLRVFSFNTLISTQTHTLAPNTFWQAGIVQIEANGPSFSVDKRACAAGDWICTDAVNGCPRP